MRAIEVKCPNCNAHLKVGEAKASITCEYCGVESAIQRRTKVFERAMPPAPDMRHLTRVALQRHSRAWVGGLVATIVFVVLGAVFSAVMASRQARSVQRASTPSRAGMSSFKPAVKPEDRPPSWQGTGVLVADVDGDGTPELVGRGRQVNAGDIIRLLALDIKTGATKWQSEPFGTYSETYQGPLTIAGDLIIHANDKAELQAFAIANGQRKWKAKLDERVKAFCPGTNDGELVAVGADDKLRTLSRADGSLIGEAKAGKPVRITGRGREAPCALLPNDQDTAYELSKPFYDTKQLYKKLEVHVDTVVTGPAGHRIVSASRSSGTRVTLLISLDKDDKELWRATASEDPLGAEGPPRHVVVGNTETCAVYYSNKYRVACFALDGGKRLWDAEVPSAFEGLTIIGRWLVITTHQHLEVRNLDTGAELWKME